MAPVAAFREAFGAVGLAPTNAQIRAYMGLPKKDHIRHMLLGSALSADFRDSNGREPDESDVEAVYARFEPALFEVLRGHAEPLPNVVATIARLRAMGIKIGSTTGYTRAMMDVLCPVAKANGYEPDCLVCPDDVGGAGRPYPYMLWENLRRLGVEDIGSVVKIGDTAADIAEGKNAGCLSVGVVYGSNMIGVSLPEYESMDAAGRNGLAEDARTAYREARADEVIDGIADVPELIARL
jgi:phosphonoacetaldehyde hydrolase